MKKNIKKIIACCLIIGVIGTVSYFGYKKYNSKGLTTNNRMLSVKVKKSNIDVTVQATGTITSVSQVDVYSQNSGVIESLPFNEGDQIKKGDLLCKIKDSTGEQNVAAAQNNLAQKNLELNTLEKSLDDLYIKAPIDGKVKSVFVSSGDDVATAKQAYGGLAILTVNDTLEVPIPFPQSGKITSVYISPGATVKKGDNLFKLDDGNIQDNIKAKKLEIQQGQNDLSFKQSGLAKTTIISPMDGVVSALSFKPGDSIDSNKPIATIVDYSQMQVVLPVDELDISKVKVGQNAKIAIDAIKDKTYEGTVEKIAQTGKTTNNVTTFDVIVSIKNPESIKPGMNANVTIAVESKENVLTIPVEAIVDRNGKQFVTIPSSSGNNNEKGKSSRSSETGQSNNNQGQRTSNAGGMNYQRSGGNSNTSEGKLVQVTLGLQNQKQAEILEGLKEGDTVLIAIPQTNSGGANANTRNNFGGGGMGNQSSGGRGMGNASSKGN